jgi:hypothetical protein
LAEPWAPSGASLELDPDVFDVGALGDLRGLVVRRF